MSQLVEFDRLTGADLITRAIRRKRKALLEQLRRIKSWQSYLVRPEHECAVDGWVSWRPTEMLKLSRRHQINIAAEVLKQLETSGQVECCRDMGNRTRRVLMVRLPKRGAADKARGTTSDGRNSNTKR